MSNEASSPFMVRGVIVDAERKPLAEVGVRALDQGLRSEAELGQGTTDEAGRYEICYGAEQVEKGRVDLVVRAYDRNGQELASSPVLFNAGPDETLNLAVGGGEYRGPSEWESLLEETEPCLVNVKPPNVPQPTVIRKLADLTDDEIEFLAQEASFGRPQLDHLVAAAKVGLATRLEAALFFGLMRQSLPATLPGLLSLNLPAWKRGLATAFSENHVPKYLEKASEGFLDSLERLAIRHRMREATAEEPSSLGDVLRLSGVGKRAQRTYVRATLEHDGPPEGFREFLTSDEYGLTERQLERLDATFSLAALAAGHAPMVSRMQELLRDGTFASERHFARAGKRFWIRTIRGARGTGFPPDTPGEDREEKIEAYAARIVAGIEAAHPAALMGFRLLADDLPVGSRETIARVLVEDPDFDLATARIDRYVREDPKGLLGDPGDDVLRGIESDLKRFQRLGKLSPRADVIAGLWGLGYGSARQISGEGPGPFIERAGGVIGHETAERVYEAAETTAGMALGFYGRIAPDFHVPAVPVLPDPSSVFEDLGLGEVRALFGPVDFCACEHCRSVYSPAAYLVDTLQFLERIDTKREHSGRLRNLTARELLFERRPDLGQIELSCENTDTVLPYVDLTNEILERAIAPLFSLPFRRIRELRDESVTPALRRAFEGAGYSLSDEAAIATDEADDNRWIVSDGNRRFLITTRREPARSLDVAVALQTHGPAEDLRANPEYVNQAAYERLAKEPFPWSLPFTLWAEEARLYLEHLGAPRHELMQALWREPTAPEDPDRFAIAAENLGLTPRDREIVTDPAETGNPTLWGFPESTPGDWARPLRALPLFLERSGLAFENLEVLFDVDFLYPRARTRLRVSAPDCDLSSATLEGLSPRAFRVAAGRIQRFVRLQRKLGWKPRDLDAALRAFGPSTLDDELLLQLSYLERLRERLGAPLLEMLSWWSKISTLRHGEAPSLYERLFLDRAIADPSTRPGSDLEVDSLALDEEGSELADTSGSIDDHASLVMAALAIDADELEGLVTRELSGDRSLSLANLTALYRAVSLARAAGLRIGDFLTFRSLTETDPFAAPEQALELLDELDVVRGSGFSLEELDYLLRHRFHPSSTVAPGRQEVVSFLTALRGDLRSVAEELVFEPDRGALVKQRLADGLGLEAEAADSLLAELLPSRDGPGKALDDFLAASFLDVDDEPAPDSAPFEQYLHFHKLAAVIAKLEIPAGDLAWVFREGPSLGWLDLSGLPLVEETSGRARFRGWLAMARAAALESALPRGEPSLFALLRYLHEARPTRRAFRERFVRRARCRDEDLSFLMGRRGFDSRFPRDYRRRQAVETLGRLEHALNLVKRLGVSAERAWGWRAPEVSPEQARTIKETVKAKHDDATWRSVVTPLRDQLRERQRDALVALLLARGPEGGRPGRFEDARALFGHYLIDVEMSSCTLTSRIKQAISSVQLFVQRCLLSLEGDVELSQHHKKQWQWRKHYRVWEANRKVFLYPENWIEPELRDGKSPFFEELENALLQDDVTEGTVEAAYREYLRKLSEVARLEIVGTYQDEGTRALHVFGRTPNAPHRYYYRRWLDESRWTPWEEVDLDIQGNHLIPVVWNRRLYLFWPIFTEKAEETIADPPEKPSRYWEIQLAWSEHRDGRWLRSVVSNEALRVAPSVETARVRFRTRGSHGDQLLILVEVFDHLGRRLDLAEPRRPRQFAMRPDGELLADPLVPELVFQVIPGARAKHQGFVEVDRDGGHPLLSLAEDPLLLPARVELETVGRLVVVRQSDIESLGRTPGRFKLALPQQHWPFSLQGPFFFEDDRRTFFVFPYFRETPLIGRPESPFDAAVDLGDGISERRLRFAAHYHPFSSTFVEQLHLFGVDGLLDPVSAALPALRYQQLVAEPFERDYSPRWVVDLPYPVEDVDFSYGGAYSLYNWELFFHIPLLIATRLSQNQRFEEALRWFHYVFDPTDLSRDEAGRLLPRPHRFWKVGPFHDPDERDLDAKGRPWSIRTLSRLLSAEAADLGDPELLALKREMEHQIRAWEDDPFRPHLIARMRLSAYQRTVFMKYLDNLIAWADQLFRRDTIESINEATQLYLLAAEILGPRPRRLPARSVANRTYHEIKHELDRFSNVLVEIENVLPPSEPGSGASRRRGGGLPALETSYFCIPSNPELLSYWDTIDDRLFKIRHCRTIEGRVRELPLFEPPIDPALLVRATAAGVDLVSVLRDLHAPLPHYRFQVVLQKAVELCTDLRSLGTVLLSALERRDAEELSLLRADQEATLLEAVKDVREQQVAEAGESLAALRQSRRLATIRSAFYKGLLGLEELPDAGELTSLGAPKLIAQEEEQLRRLASAALRQQSALELELAAQVYALYPDITLGSSGIASPVVTAELGGSFFAQAMRAFAAAQSLGAARASSQANRAAIVADHHRTSEQWSLQLALATQELEQLDKQIEAARIRVSIAEKDLESHLLQIDHAKDVEELLRDRFTSRELYGWKVSQVSGLYFRSYQLAYDFAKSAERAYRYELGLADSDFIRFGYWDSLKKGLLAGEKLHHDLKRLEVAHFEQSLRELEITKHVSLAMLDPFQLLRLKETGRCDIRLPEEIFDLDYPGHYMRRIKSASLTIPCVTGPYAGVHCKLTLARSEVRTSPNLTDPTRTELAAVRSVVTSNARDDAGLFELNLRDERYLPFEGAGAWSDWHLELGSAPAPGADGAVDFRQFDHDTIADVILHLRYTARDGGEAFRRIVQDGLRTRLEGMELAEGSMGLLATFSAKRHFSNAWHAFLHPAAEGDPHRLAMDLRPERFPYVFSRRGVEIDSMYLFLRLVAERPVEAALPFQVLGPREGPVAPEPLIFHAAGSPIEGLHHAVAFEGESFETGRYALLAERGDVEGFVAATGDADLPEAIDDVIVVCRFRLLTE